MGDNKSVVLCGFMGCGKSTVGKRLATVTGREFVDMDTYIEQTAGICVSEIFARHGEAYFRALETQACKELALRDGLVIAAGGGALISPENARILRARCTVVYLDVTPETVLSRLEGDTMRPLLQGEGKEARVRELMSVRRPLYEAAAHVAVAADGDFETVAARVATLL